MDSRAELPPALRPASGDLVWRADIGAEARVDTIAQHFAYLDTAVKLGERWGTEFAREAAYRSLVLSGGQPGIGTQLGTAKFNFGDPAGSMRMQADLSLLDFMGTSVRVREATYRNPIEVLLGGGGLLFTGVVTVLRLVRDWSNERRKGAAEADEAEAVARERELRVDVLRWLVDETRDGRIAVPPGQLLALVSDRDEVALDGLADSRPQLELPSSLEQGREPGESSRRGRAR
jgi:hypothetical protein